MNTTAKELIDRFPDLKPWELEDYLDSDDAIEAHVNHALEVAVQERDPTFLNAVLAAIVRKQSITKLAKDTGLSRPALYDIVNQKADPRLSTLFSVLNALGYSLDIRRRGTSTQLEPV